MTTVYFDESGNTGRQLADLDQPLFILGSCDFSDEECAQLLGPLRSRQAAEIHFKRLRKTPRGQDRIIELLQSELVTPARFKSMVVHKRFMLLTKIMDDLLENLVHRLGENFYENGQNLALSNMLQCVLPMAVGQELFDQFLSRYYDMCILKTDEAITAFYEHIEVMQARCANTALPMEVELGLLMMTRAIVTDVLEDTSDSTFNPAIPTLFSLCVFWGRQYPHFDALCDDSEPLERQTGFLEMFAELRNEATVIGHGHNQFELPLKLDNLAFSASHESDGIQVADVITSALAYFLNKRHKGETEDEFFQKLNALGKLDDLVTGTIWPTLDVTPEALGRAGDEFGHNPADAITEFLMQASGNRPR